MSRAPPEQARTNQVFFFECLDGAGEHWELWERYKAADHTVSAHIQGWQVRRVLTAHKFSSGVTGLNHYDYTEPWFLGESISTACLA